MAYVDQVVGYMVQQKASAFVITAGQNVVLHVGEQTYPQNQVLTAEQVGELIRQTAPANLQSQMNTGEDFEYPYNSASGPVTLRVTHTDGRLVLTIVPGGAAQAAAPTQAQPVHIAGGDKAAKYLNIPADRVGKKVVNHLDELYHILFETDASDLHCTSGEYPMMRLHGTLVKLMEYEKWSPEKLRELLWAITPKRNQEEWEETHDTDFAYELPGIARFRCNVFADRFGMGGVFRIIPSQIATVEDLKLPKAMVDLCYLPKGLVVVTGPTGSGKSTTLAALVDYVNRVRTDHIITVEDPIEFVHVNNQCLVNQREVHVHTDSFKKALRAALREDPDVVLVGEMRDLETVAIAIETAETGHLVFGTLHTSSAASTVDRIIDQFPAAQQEQIRVMLSESLKAVIAQTLLKRKAGGRVAAWEILLCPPSVANLIREKKTFQLNSMIQVNKGMGMITMNDAVMPLVRDGIVDPMEAYFKVIDKAGLQTLYERDGIDFRPPGQEELLKH